MVSLNLKEMSREEKIATMEAIWADLSQSPDHFQSPEWHREALTKAQDAVENGTARFRPLAEVKKRINEAVS